MRYFIAPWLFFHRDINEWLFVCFQVTPLPSYCFLPMFVCVCYVCVLYYALLSIRIYNSSLDYVFDIDSINVVVPRTLKMDCASEFHTQQLMQHALNASKASSNKYSTIRNTLICSLSTQCGVCVRLTRKLTFIRRPPQLIRNHLWMCFDFV